MLENIEVLRHLWSRDGDAFEGRFHRFEGLALQPKPAGEPVGGPVDGGAPIWLATNSKRLADSGGEGEALEIAVGRVAAYADGWMTHSITPAAFDRSWARILEAAEGQGRDTAHFDNCLYHNIVVDEDRERALRTAKAYLDGYYGLDFKAAQLEAMVSWGSPEQCAENLRRFLDGAVRRIAFRICSADAFGQLDRLTTEVLPLVND
jgi:alkanesulfonate monooxygenase SsuD/methylene tetrahydromethanopterin reductase-like flavin-dependent oxidoreductase (luciferase family)